MPALVRRIIGGRRVLAGPGHPRHRGRAAGGRAVASTTRVGAEEEAVRLSEHYGSRVVVGRGSAVAVPPPRFTPPPQGPTASAAVTEP